MRGVTVLACAGAFALTGAVPAFANSGDLDTSFGTGGYANVSADVWDAAAAVAVQPDGKIVTAGQGYFDTTRLHTELLVTRTDTTGHDTTVWHIDAGGNQSSGVDSGAALALQTDGKIVVAGTAKETSGNADFLVVRLNADGTPDPGFGQNGIVMLPIGTNNSAIANAVAIDANGDIVVSGGVSVSGTPHWAVARLTPAGNRDPGFGSNGVAILSPQGTAWGEAIQSDGKIVLAGQGQVPSSLLPLTTQPGYQLVRLNTNGALDPSFGTSGVASLTIGTNADALAMGLQSDGKIVVSGNATINLSSQITTARLNTNGSLDQSFGSGGLSSFAGSGLNALTIDPSGRIDLAGVTGSNTAFAARLTSGGSLDQSFGTGGVAAHCDSNQCAANGIAVQPADGKLVLGGARFDSAANRYDVQIQRLQP